MTQYDTPGLAKAAANKQMADRLAKDYRETGAKTKPVKVKAGPKPVSKAKPAVSKARAAARPAVAKAVKSTKSIDELFARGYPHLRRIAPPLGKVLPPR